MMDNVVGVTGGQFAHESHGNEVDRQQDVTTRRRSRSRWSRRLTPIEPGVGQWIRTTGLPLTRSTAPGTVRASCTDGTDHRADSSHHAGIIWRAGPRTGPRPRLRRPAILLQCVTPLRASVRACTRVGLLDRQSSRESLSRRPPQCYLDFRHARLFRLPVVDRW